MQVGTYPTRNFATFGQLELQPPFTGAYCQCLNISILLYSTGQVSVSIQVIYNLQRPVFLINSRFSFFNVSFFSPYDQEIKTCSFSRSYRVNLQSSFKILLSIALVYSTHPPVAVFSTVLN